MIHCTERLATELNTGRKRHTIPWGEGKGFEEAMARCEVSNVVVLMLVSSGVLLHHWRDWCVWAVQALGGQFSTAGSSHPSLLCKAAVAAENAMMSSKTLSLASRAGAPWSHVCNNVKIVNGKYCLEKLCSLALSLCLSITGSFLTV